ncbi:hypothetical protein PInf_020183 [Phytophthora infestans]|nr:hypothetical protein PInf_020183 [Phytophthora infestans]
MCFRDIFDSFVAGPHAKELIPLVEERWADCEQPLTLLAVFLHPGYLEVARALPNKGVSSIDSISNFGVFYFKRFFPGREYGMLRYHIVRWCESTLYIGTEHFRFDEFPSVAEYWKYAKADKTNKAAMASQAVKERDRLDNQDRGLSGSVNADDGDVVDEDSEGNKYAALGAVDQCEKAGLLDTSSGTEAVPRSRAETDWPDAVQDLETGQVAVPGRRRPTRRLDWCGRFVFSVGFLADVLEWISLWYIRSSGMGAFAGSVASAAAIDATTFNWVLKLFLDVGAPDRVLLSYYEQLYREQPERLYREGWTLHLLQSMLTIITIWKKHAISPRTGKDQNAEFAAGGRGSDEAGVDLDAFAELPCSGMPDPQQRFVTPRA